MQLLFGILLFASQFTAFGDQKPERQFPDPSILSSAGFTKMNYLADQKSNVLHLPDGVGDYCSSWIKMINAVPKEKLPDPVKFFPQMFRAVLCRPVDGKCREVRSCTFNFDKTPRPTATYVPLPQDDLKFEKDGTTIEYEPDVETDSKTERGTYLKEKHAALFNLPTKTEKKLWLCSIPVRISSTGAEPAKPNDTIACLANEKPEGKFDCPGVKACYEKRIDSHIATMASTHPNTGSTLAVLRPHATFQKHSSLDVHSEAAH
jgi:hypothetical protein